MTDPDYTKPRRAKPEEKIQREIVQYLRTVMTKDYRVIAVPNAARRTRGGRAGNAVPGLSKGFPDLLIVEAGGGAYAIEVKAPKGVISPEQNEWKQWFFLHSFPHCVARSVDDVKVALTHWKIETREAA